MAATIPLAAAIPLAAFYKGGFEQRIARFVGSHESESGMAIAAGTSKETSS